MKNKEKMLELMRHYRLVKNASPSWESHGGMLEYWEERTGIDLSRGWRCPKCTRKFNRDKLHGAHIVYFIGESKQQFITPLCVKCNEKKDQSPFMVYEEHLIPAPKP